MQNVFWVMSILVGLMWLAYAVAYLRRKPGAARAIDQAASASTRGAMLAVNIVAGIAFVALGVLGLAGVVGLR